MHTWNPSDVDRDRADRDRADRDRYDSPDTFDLHGRPRRSDGRWPLAGAAAAVLGALGSFVLGWDPDEGITQAGTDAIYREAGEHGSVIRAGASLGFVAVAALIVFAAGFTRALGRRAPDSLAVPVMRTAFGAAAACLIFAFGLKHVLAGGVPGGIDDNFYTPADVEVFSVLVSQMQYAAWWGVMLAAAAAAVLAFSGPRVLPRWFGAVSVALSGISIGATLLVGLPYSAGLLAPLWLLAAAVAAYRIRPADAARGRHR
ncbi:hypothetical protein AB1484_30420 [Parafrankia sp. FMc6]|uniref:hypothetical protein n=1 Tax=Parafrankia soli TaxID=2599596 RepID=UPI0034D4DA1C